MKVLNSYKDTEMNYHTTNELEHFGFTDAYIGDIQHTNGFFHMVLDNVTILPENSCNRDIREMRANNLLLKIADGKILSIIEEGYKVYDANGKEKETYADREIAEADFGETVKSLVDGIVYSLKKKENRYEFVIDAENERTYQMVVAGTADEEEWDRFINK